MRGDTLRRHLQASFAECICTSCKRRGCELGLDGLSTHHLIIIDADKYKKCHNLKGKLCDHILFYLEDSTTVAVVELKGGLTKVYEAQKQIKNGSKIAEQITTSHRVSNFFPILLHRKGIGRLDIQILKKAKVRFKDKDWMIIVERCGSQLSGIIRQWQYPAS